MRMYADRRDSDRACTGEPDYYEGYPGARDSDRVYPPGVRDSDRDYPASARDSDRVYPPGVRDSDRVYSPGARDSDRVYPPGTRDSNRVYSPVGNDSDRVYSHGADMDGTYYDPRDRDMDRVRSGSQDRISAYPRDSGRVNIGQRRGLNKGQAAHRFKNREPPVRSPSRELGSVSPSRPRRLSDRPISREQHRHKRDLGGARRGTRGRMNRGSEGVGEGECRGPMSEGGEDESKIRSTAFQGRRSSSIDDQVQLNETGFNTRNLNHLPPTSASAAAMHDSRRSSRRSLSSSTDSSPGRAHHKSRKGGEVETLKGPKWSDSKSAGVETSSVGEEVGSVTQISASIRNLVEYSEYKLFNVC